jgi:hypothetical protein
MAVSLESELQLGVNQVNGLFNEALERLRFYTPAEGQDFPLDLDTLEAELNSLPLSLITLLSHQNEVVKQLGGTNGKNIRVGDFGAQFINYEEGGWVYTEVPGFVVNLESADGISRFECEDTPWGGSPGSGLDFIDSVRLVEMTNNSSRGLISVNTVGIRVRQIKWERSTPRGEFSNLRQVTFH